MTLAQKISAVNRPLAQFNAGVSHKIPFRFRSARSNDTSKTGHQPEALEIRECRQTE